MSTKTTVTTVTDRRPLPPFTGRAEISRMVGLVRELLRAYDRLMKPARRSDH